MVKFLIEEELWAPSIQGEPAAALPRWLWDWRIVPDIQAAGHSQWGFLAGCQQVIRLVFLCVNNLFSASLISSQCFLDGRSSPSRRYVCKWRWIFNHSWWQVLPASLGEDAVSLLSALLTYHPSKRITARYRMLNWKWKWSLKELISYLTKEPPLIMKE